MNSRKREKQDRAVTEYPLTHIVRSHRRPVVTITGTRRAVSAVLSVAAVLALAGTPLLLLPASKADTVPVRPAVAIAEPLTAPDPRVSRDTSREEATKPPTPVTHLPVKKVTPPCSRCVRIDILVKYALAQVGDSYRWAADGPNSFDCSGLVLAAYARVGIKLPHYTGDIIDHGRRISRSQLQRGDIVFPESGHVGIYLGNGRIVHASSSKGGVVVGSLYSFYAARRLF